METKNWTENIFRRFKDTIKPSQLFIFTNVIRCSRLPLWLAYFIYFKYIHVSSVVYQSLIFSSIKETNWLINKGMRVILFDVFKEQIFRKCFFEKYCSCDKACQFSGLQGTLWQSYLESPTIDEKIIKPASKMCWEKKYIRTS